jgi:hypothetical protein
MSLVGVITRCFAILGLVFVALGAGGCSTQTGEYAPVKQQWDSPRSSEIEDTLRNRLVHTQRDN